MKKIYSIIAIAAISSWTTVSATRYATPGDKGVYTLEKLSSIEGSGVEKNGNVYTMLNDTLEISAGDTFTLDNNATLRLGDRALVLVYGNCNFNSVDTATVTRAAETDIPKGFYLQDNATFQAENVTFEYAQLRASSTNPINLKNCTFQYADTKLNSSGAVILTGNCDGNIIDGCSFIQSVSAAVGGAANIPTGVIIRNCYLYDNNTGNSNRPQLNITVGGDYKIEITNNTIIGAERTKVGAISVSNMLSIAGENKVLIKDNYMTKNRYGITTLGAQDVEIIGNKIIDNKYETNAMNGGSGISIYDTANKQKCYIQGNHIEECLWGVTNIGCGNVNMGKVSDTSAADYNPGLNSFKNNGNGGVLYDLYNNSSYTVYAQGNCWNVDEQTKEKIETVVFHVVDNASLGEVIFMPSNPEAGVADVEQSSIAYRNGMIVCDTPAQVVVYNAAGALVASSQAQVSEYSLSALSTGMYIVKAGNAVMKIMK